MLESVTALGYPAYAVALVALWGVFGVGRLLNERKANARLQNALSFGHVEPPSLHPVIDPSRCVGCGACSHACPEGKIIAMIAGKAQLIDPGSCIGHGACKTVCPVGAIDLVFGTARRGVDIPLVNANFESTVPGVYIAGELGGMGLIANAIEQGKQAIDAIADSRSETKRDLYDVVIVGGGPAGIAATLAAKEKGLRALTLEQNSLGGTVAHYPRAKLVMTRPARLPLFGQVRLRRVRKERLIALWQSVVRKTGITIHNGVRVERIAQQPWGFEVTTSAGPALTRTVLLATGRRGVPRKLGVPGEHLSHVAYRVDDPARYRGQHVLIVGGGDSALEAALALARERVAAITVTYRGSVPARAKPAIRRRFEDVVAAGRITVIAGSHVGRIETGRAIVFVGQRAHAIRADSVIICAGGVLPMELLSDIGVRVETKYGTA